MRRVMVVEDDADGRDVLSELLMTWGYQVEAFASANVASRRYREQPFDVALLDLGLADSDGLKLVEDLRGASADLVIICYSGHDRLRQAALDAGCDHFVLKPSVEHLQEALERPARSPRTRGTGRHRSHT